MTDDQNATIKYEKLETLGKKIFAGQKLTQETITKNHVELAKKFLIDGASEINPQVLPAFWEHILLSPNLGKRIAEKLASTQKSVNPNAIEFLLYLHDIGRLIIPSAYFRNDLIGDRLLLAVGLEKELIDNLPPLGRISVLADEEEFNDEELNFEKPLSTEQKKTVQKYFDSLSPTQRIINLADNLGKRDNNGIFNLASFENYLKTQEKRYSEDSHWACIHWAIQRRRGAALFQYHLVKKTYDWLGKLNIKVDKILHELKNYGPKFVLIIRHGELENPTNLAYNRDSVMKTPIHLSTLGKEHMQKVGELIATKKFNLTKIITSPEIRTQESALELKNKLDLPITIDNYLDEVYAPDPYNRGWKMDKLIDLGGDIYNLPNTESPESVTRRMLKIFNITANSLKTGEAAILLSHGDPIVFLTQFLKTQSIPNPKILREIAYPAKGQATIAIIGADGNIFTLYLLEENIEQNTY
jgi:broad specificity phosphatase PhoE